MILSLLLGAALTLAAPKTAARVPPPPPLDRVQLLGWLIGGVEPAYLTGQVRARGTSFAPTEDYLTLVRTGRGGDSLIQVLRASPPRVGAASPDEDSLLAIMTRAIGRFGDRDQAGTERELVAATHRAPRNAALRLALGNAYSGRGEADSAMAQFRSALEIEPSIPWAHLQLGSVHQFQHDLTTAAHEMHEEIALHPENAAAHRMLGFLLKLAGDLPNAIVEERESVRLDPSNPTGRMQLANALYVARDFPGAEEQARAAAALAPTPQGAAAAHVIRGLALRSQMDIPASIEAFRAAVAADSTNPDAHFGLGRGLALNGQEAEAVGAFRNAIRRNLNPNDMIHARVQCGMILQQQGKLEEAFEEFRRASEADPTNDDIRQILFELSQRVNRKP